MGARWSRFVDDIVDVSYGGVGKRVGGLFLLILFLASISFLLYGLAGVSPSLLAQISAAVIGLYVIYLSVYLIRNERDRLRDERAERLARVGVRTQPQRNRGSESESSLRRFTRSTMATNYPHGPAFEQTMKAIEEYRGLVNALAKKVDGVQKVSQEELTVLKDQRDRVLGAIEGHFNNITQLERFNRPTAEAKAE